jgi:hypothetical protein
MGTCIPIMSGKFDFSRQVKQTDHAFIEVFGSVLAHKLGIPAWNVSGQGQNQR